MASIQTRVLITPSFHIVIVVNFNSLHQDIYMVLLSGPITTKHSPIEDCWSIDSFGFLLLNSRIYVPLSSNLCICVL